MIATLGSTHEALWGAVGKFDLSSAITALNDSTIVAANGQYFNAWVRHWRKPPSLAFILIPISESLALKDAERTAQLEQDLWSIANEIPASGIVENVIG